MSDNYGLQKISTFYSPWGNGRDWCYIGDMASKGGKRHWEKSGPIRKTPPYGQVSAKTLAKRAPRPGQLPRAHQRTGVTGESFLVLETVKPLPLSRTVPSGLRQQSTTTLPRCHHQIACNGDVVPVMEDLPPRARSAPSGDILQQLGQLGNTRGGRCRSLGSLELEAKKDQRPASAGASPVVRGRPPTPAIPFQQWQRNGAGNPRDASKMECNSPSQVSALAPSLAL